MNIQKKITRKRKSLETNGKTILKNAKKHKKRIAFCSLRCIESLQKTDETVKAEYIHDGIFKIYSIFNATECVIIIF